mmetsp:Transcript_21425/g.35340  ORF Transcript_21425/g.35340 Transcript_21425/m.35340 type:complete len:250 (-) Transcript_21425:511-1260(-)
MQGTPHHNVQLLLSMRMPCGVAKLLCYLYCRNVACGVASCRCILCALQRRSDISCFAPGGSTGGGVAVNGNGDCGCAVSCRTRNDCCLRSSRKFPLFMPSATLSTRLERWARLASLAASSSSIKRAPAAPRAEPCLLRLSLPMGAVLMSSPFTPELDCRFAAAAACNSACFFFLSSMAAQSLLYLSAFSSTIAKSCRAEKRCSGCVFVSSPIHLIRDRHASSAALCRASTCAIRSLAAEWNLPREEVKA